MNRSGDRRTCKAAKPRVPHLLEAVLEVKLPQKADLPVPPGVTSAREAAQGPASWRKDSLLSPPACSMGLC